MSAEGGAGHHARHLSGDSDGLFVAVIGAAGLAIGLALSGTLQNFAGGVVLLAIRPFRVGDQIKAQSFEGKVKAIGIFQTMLVTPDNLTVFIPNGELMNESIMNYSLQGTRRADLLFGIGYDDDIDHAREVILRVIGGEERILKEPAPLVILRNLGESSVDIEARFWVVVTDHFSVSNAIREAVKKAFDAEGISFPFPQRDVRIIQADHRPLRKREETNRCYALASAETSHAGSPRPAASSLNSATSPR